MQFEVLSHAPEEAGAVEEGSLVLALVAAQALALRVLVRRQHLLRRVLVQRLGEHLPINCNFLGSVSN